MLPTPVISYSSMLVRTQERFKIYLKTSGIRTWQLCADELEWYDGLSLEREETLPSVCTSSHAMSNQIEIRSKCALKQINPRAILKARKQDRNIASVFCQRTSHQKKRPITTGVPSDWLNLFVEWKFTQSGVTWVTIRGHVGRSLSV